MVIGQKQYIFTPQPLVLFMRVTSSVKFSSQVHYHKESHISLILNVDIFNSKDLIITIIII